MLDLIMTLITWLGSLLLLLVLLAVWGLVLAMIVVTISQLISKEGLDEHQDRR